MSTSLHFFVYSAVMTWLMLHVAAILRTRAWTPTGLKIAFGNRGNMTPHFTLGFPR